MKYLIGDPDIRKSLELQLKFISQDLNDGEASVGSLTVRLQDIINTLLNSPRTTSKVIRRKYAK